MFADDEAGGESDAGEEQPYSAPILAADEVAKNPSNDHLPAVEPPVERRGSAFEMEEPHSRPTSRPASIYKESSFEARHTPLEDVDEYEPLFPEEETAKKKAEAARKLEEYKRRFPSRDVWEDAPSSVHDTAEVSVPEAPEQQETKPPQEIPPRETETPAQAFARKHEELAEKEAHDPVFRKGKPATSWVQLTPHLSKDVVASRPGKVQRFPSRDIWEDSPDSHQLETTVDTPQQEQSPVDKKQPDIPQRLVRKLTDPSSASGDKPSIPDRPKPKREGSEENVTKPTIPDRPKPQVPARPAKQPAGTDKDAEDAGPRSKPAVPARPLGGKIAALQAGFMSDLNKRLQLGPQAPKKEEAPAEDLAEEKEKAPLSDARKGRARGPQRRAPRSSPSPAAALSTEPAAEKAPPSLSFSITTTVFSINPDGDVVRCGAEKGDELAEGQTETLAANMAGETIVETTTKEGVEQEVEPINVEEVAKD